jgi:hypothetical protein
MLVKFRTLVGLLVTVWSVEALCAGVVTGNVEFLQAGLTTGTDGHILVKIYQTPSNQPACATNPRFSVNPATDVGKALLALLLAAQASGKTVQIWGTGSCDQMAGFESLSYMRLLD